MEPKPQQGSLLEVQSLTKAFGGLVAVSNVSLHVNSGQITAIIGPNGAGKSTLLNLISGLIRPDQGRVRLRSEDISDLPSFEIAHRGVSRTFQQLHLFGRASVRENILIGYHRFVPNGVWDALLRWWASGQASKRAQEAVEAAARSVMLLERLDDPVDVLPLGQQRMVELARALVSQPQVLLLDEPAAGLTHPEQQELATILRSLRDENIGVVLIDHELPLVLELADQVVVMNFGQVIAVGTPAEIRQHPAVIEAYIGTELAPT